MVRAHAINAADPGSILSGLINVSMPKKTLKRKNISKYLTCEFLNL